MFEFWMKYFKKEEEKVETEEDRHKLRLTCIRGKWRVEEKIECGDILYWATIFTSEDQEEARVMLQEARTRVYNMHNGTVEYW